MPSHPVDVHVGHRLRLRRTMLGMSQDSLAKAVKLTFQQIQKYERGINRIGSSRLFQFSSILNVPVSYFFEEFGGTAARPENIGVFSVPGLAESGPLPFEAEKLGSKETLEMLRAYYKIKDNAMRKKIFDLIKSIAETQTETQTEDTKTTATTAA